MDPKIAVATKKISISSVPAGQFARRVLPFIFLLGVFCSLYSLLHFFELRLNPNAAPSFCNISAAINCDAVTRSPYSSLFGWPLASYGVVFYLSLLIFSLVTLNTSRMSARVIGAIHITLSLFAAAFSLVLFWISYSKIQSICLVCVALYLISFAYAVLAWRAYPGEALLSRLKHGVGLLLRWPLFALGGMGAPSAQAARLARLGLLSVALVIATTAIVLPELLLKFILVPAIPQQSSVDDIVRRWREAAVQDIELDLEQGSDMDYSKGAVFAPIRVIVFSDFECPACRRFHQAVDQVLADFPGKLHFVHRNYPLDNACNPSIQGEFHKNACFAAQFARCAGEQGKFWEAADFVYTLDAFESGQPPDEVRRAMLAELDYLGLDAPVMTACMDQTRQKAKLLDDIRVGNQLGLESTPSVWVNGKKLPVASGLALRGVVQYILESTP